MFKFLRINIYNVKEESSKKKEIIKSEACDECKRKKAVYTLKFQR